MPMKIQVIGQSMHKVNNAGIIRGDEASNT